MSLTNLVVNKNMKKKECFLFSEYILSLFDILQNFLVITNGTMDDYYSQTCHIQVASPVAKRLNT